MIIDSEDRVLVTGSTGFMGSRVVAALLDHGFRDVSCFARPSSNLGRVEELAARRGYAAGIDVTRRNLLFREDREGREGLAMIGDDDMRDELRVVIVDDDTTVLFTCSP